jgi:hypothetical protein
VRKRHRTEGKGENDDEGERGEEEGTAVKK